MLEHRSNFQVRYCTLEPDWLSLVNAIRNPQPKQLLLEEVDKCQIAHSPARMRLEFPNAVTMVMLRSNVQRFKVVRHRC